MSDQFWLTKAQLKHIERDPNALGKIPPPIRTMFEHYDHDGLLGSPLSLRAILGREPRTLRAYFEAPGRGRAGVELNTTEPLRVRIRAQYQSAGIDMVPGFGYGAFNH